MEGDLEVDLDGDSKWDFRGDFKHDIKGDLLSSSGQVSSRSGLVQVWFSLQPKFNSFELDSEVGRLVKFWNLGVRGTSILCFGRLLNELPFICNSKFELYI